MGEEGGGVRGKGRGLQGVHDFPIKPHIGSELNPNASAPLYAHTTFSFFLSLFLCFINQLVLYSRPVIGSLVLNKGFAK